MKLIAIILLLIPIVLKNSFCSSKSTIKEKKKTLEVTVSVYNPIVSQCDSTPLQTASLKIIDTVKLKKGKLKWCAISRDLKRKYKFGDIIHIKNIGKLSGKYMIVDLMNKRYRKRVDILHYSAKHCKQNGKIVI